GETLRVAGHLNQRRWIRDGQTRWGRLELVARTIGPGPELPKESPIRAESNDTI
ncbi:MAG: hypothetical protein HQL53_11200, partial [Magnetococcales bacterium]|nr:hypothetical protein [Magnetococcales bacterium]